LESESPLAFAALQRLLRPVMARAVDLPPPQARALRLAFGEAEGDQIDPFPRRPGNAVPADRSSRVRPCAVSHRRRPLARRRLL
jgi:hypothetical protein